MRSWSVCIGLALLFAGVAQAAADVDALWNYEQPAESEARFRSALVHAKGDDALVLRTQIARTLGLRGRFDEAHRELDAIEPVLEKAGVEPRVRVWLERGRTWRSSNRPTQALPLFMRAYEQALSAKLDALAADALHMVALTQPSLAERTEWNRRTVAFARASADPKAQRWDAPALNNLGDDLRTAGRLQESLEAFKDALQAYQRSERAASVRFARWQVANVLRLQGRSEEALAMQLALEQEAGAAGQVDAEVFDELALIFAARGNLQRADHYRALHAKAVKP